MFHRALAVAVIVALPCSLMAQAVPGPHSTPGDNPFGVAPPPPEVQGKMAELQAIAERLKAVRDEAAKVPKVKKAMESFRSDIEKQMIKDDPALKPKVARFHAIEKQLDGLVAKGEFDKAQPILLELRTLATELTAAQSKAIEAKHLAARAPGMEKQLRDEMRRIEPKMPQMLARADQLKAELQKVMMAQPPPPRPAPTK